MTPPAAKKGDRVTALDTHMIQPPGTSPPVPTPHPFAGIIDGALSGDVKIQGKAAATVDSTATNSPSHSPIGGKKAARAGDTAETCNDPKDLPVGTVMAVSTVNIGG
jgi:uncharacterized Zn-binding protein involved in type VI secretion